MSIWFYLFITFLGVSIFLIIKVLMIKKDIKGIGSSLSYIIKTDTNNLITVSSTDRDIRYLASILNSSLKDMRKLEIEYKSGNQDLKSSITNISHDLRTPLTAVRGYLDLLDNSNLTEKQMKYIEVIDSKVKDLTDLTEQLFDFSKSIDIQNEIEKENICINDILEETLASYYSLFNEHNIIPNIDICKDKVIRFLNENMLKRIFENIISNVIKHSEGNFNVVMYADGTVEFSNKTDKLDNVSLKKIFDRYYTVKNMKKSHGIGLAIAKQLVDLSGGKIDALLRNNILTIRVVFNKDMS